MNAVRDKRYFEGRINAFGGGNRQAAVSARDYSPEDLERPHAMPISQTTATTARTSRTAAAADRRPPKRPNREAAVKSIVQLCHAPVAIFEHFTNTRWPNRSGWWGLGLRSGPNVPGSVRCASFSKLAHGIATSRLQPLFRSPPAFGRAIDERIPLPALQTEELEDVLSGLDGDTVVKHGPRVHFETEVNVGLRRPRIEEGFDAFGELCCEVDVLALVTDARVWLVPENPHAGLPIGAGRRTVPAPR